jgi:hypothetical protein
METLVRAFPSRLHSAALEVLGLLPTSDLEPVREIAASYTRACPDLRVESEPVSIPYRIYNPRPEQSLLQRLGAWVSNGKGVGRDRRLIAVLVAAGCG